MMGSLDSQSSEEEVEKPEKRKKAKDNRGTRTSKRTRREKILIRRLEVTSSSKDHSSDDDVIELDYIPASPSQSDIDAFEVDDPPAQDRLNTEVSVIGSGEPENQVEEGEIPSTQGVDVHEPTQGSHHELQLHSTTKDDTTVEGEQKTDETHEPDRTEEQPSHGDTRQLFSEVGENPAASKGLDTSSTPITDQLQICNEPTESIKEQSGNLTIASGQTIPQDWLVARAQRKAATYRLGGHFLSHRLSRMSLVH